MIPLSAMLPFYDFIITFGDESGLFWKKRVTGASVLFFASRYLTIVEFIRGFFENFVTVK